MAFEPSVAVLDACVLYPFHLRNVLVQAAIDRLIDARWTNEIHGEWMRSLIADVPSIPLERLLATRQLMNIALPGATVSGYAELIPTLELPNPDDRHVVAAAITARAQVILTWNLRDFPAAALKKHGIRRQTPDAFLAELYDREPELMVSLLANARRNLNKSRVSAAEFIDILAAQNLTQLVTRLKQPDLELETEDLFTERAEAAKREDFTEFPDGAGDEPPGDGGDRG